MEIESYEKDRKYEFLVKFLREAPSHTTDITIVEFFNKRIKKCRNKLRRLYRIEGESPNKDRIQRMRNLAKEIEMMEKERYKIY